MKIAVVKQEVYDDYWVGPMDMPKDEIIFSSMMRVGQASLFLDYNADPIIVKEDFSPECQTWVQKTRYEPPENFRMLKTKSCNKRPGQSHKCPVNSTPPGTYAMGYDDLNWGVYDIVICHDIPIPADVTKLYPKTLWCYMIQEPFMAAFSGPIMRGYDVRLNQSLGTTVQRDFGDVNFPAPFIGSFCLYELMRRTLNRPSEKSGVYPEINMCTGRPISHIPHQGRLEKFGKIRTHAPIIKDNLTNLYDAKYFVKIGGRYIRGNAIVEAISCNTLVLMDSKDVIYNSLLPKETKVKNIDELCKKIEFLEKHPDEYDRLLMMQKDLVQEAVVNIPMQSLFSLWDKKKNGSI